MSKSRNWCFTLNNPKSLPDIEHADNLRYGCYQEETGDTGTHHLQGYLEFIHPLSLRGVKRSISGLHGAHLEVRRGTSTEARNYCRKPGGWNFTEHGEFRGNLSDMDLDEAWLVVKASVSNEGDWHHRPCFRSILRMTLGV